MTVQPFSATAPVKALAGSNTDPSITFTGDTDTGLYSPGANQVAVTTDGTQRLLIDENGAITVANKFSVPLGTKELPSIYFGSDTNTGIYSPGADQVAISTNGTGKLFIDSAGKVTVKGVGTAAFVVEGTAPDNSLVIKGSTGNVGIGASIPGSLLQVGQGAASTYTDFVINGATTANYGPKIALQHGGSEIFEIANYGRVQGGTSSDVLVETVGSNKLQLGTDRTVALTIDTSQRVAIGITTLPNNEYKLYVQNSQSGIYVAGKDANGNYAGIVVERTSSDGDLISFLQAGTLEGTISVSGTTVSYNGAHLSRWSQLPGIDPYDKTARPEILRGTVMSNLDEMCDWTCPITGDCQDNEQLNKTKISDVEGDKNVAGVFQSWDDGDDTWVNDYYLAMTGDFVIRIKPGVTVQRGDLLMSAGDGTAKPQDDDIIRSKTIAKVTSTNVSCTHPDGSYCVPCVLMAC